MVDQLGFVEDAIDRAIELAALDKESVQVIEYRQQKGILDQMLFGPESQSKAQAHRLSQLSALMELNVPRAYYLCTWLPGISE